MKTYYAPDVHARTGAVMKTTLFQPEFVNEYLFFGVGNIDSPMAIPLGGVKVLLETDDFVMAIDFVSVRAS